MDFRDVRRLEASAAAFAGTEEFQIITGHVPPAGPGMRFFEVGAAPGFYGAVFWKHLGYRPGGVEYTDKGFDSIRRLMAHVGAPDDGYTKGDFLEYRPAADRDVVFSSGFVEHFDDYAGLMRKHANCARPGGYVVISVPNYHFLYRHFQERIYPGLISVQHNVEIMGEAAFEKTCRALEAEGKLKILFLGGFGQPRVAGLVARGPFLQKFLYLVDEILKLLGVYRLAKRLSREPSTLIVIAQKTN